MGQAAEAAGRHQGPEGKLSAAAKAQLEQLLADMRTGVEFTPAPADQRLRPGDPHHQGWWWSGSPS